MTSFVASLKTVVTSSKGISAMEYAALAAVIVVGISAAATPLSAKLATVMTSVTTAL